MMALSVNTLNKIQIKIKTSQIPIEMTCISKDVLSIFKLPVLFNLHVKMLGF
jgi:hypothetical protein